jgi:hypothetical protein
MWDDLINNNIMKYNICYIRLSCWWQWYHNIPTCTATILKYYYLYLYIIFIYYDVYYSNDKRWSYDAHALFALFVEKNKTVRVPLTFKLFVLYKIVLYLFLHVHYLQSLFKIFPWLVCVIILVTTYYFC